MQTNVPAKPSITDRLKSFEWTLLIQFIAGLIIFFASQYLIIRVKYKDIFDWWSTNGGAAYDKYFSVFGYASAKESRVLNWISMLFGNLFNSLEKKQILFLDAVAIKNRVWADTTGLAHGFVMPRHLCESITFAPKENPYVDARTENKNLDLTVAAVYVYDSKYVVDKKPTELPNFTPQLKAGNNGVYPSPVDQSSWQCKLIEWGVPVFYTNSISGNTYVLPWIPDDPGLKQKVLAKWYGLDASGNKLTPDKWETNDNFFAYYGIPPDSDLIVGFFNNNWYTSGNQLSTSGLKYLLSPTYGSAGGWVGFLQVLYAANVSLEDLLSIVFNSVDPPTPTGPAKDSSDNCGGSGWLGASIGGLSSGAGIGMAAHAITGNAYVTGGFALASALASVFSSQSKCL